MLLFYDEFKTPTSNIVTTSYEFMGKHFQHFVTTQGYFSVWKRVVVLPRSGAISPNKEEKWLDCRCREAKEMFNSWQMLFLGGGGMRTLGIDWASMMTMQPSLTTMKTETAYEQALHLRDIEWSNAEEDAGARCSERKWELTCTFAWHSK